MHLLVRETRSLDELAQAVDLQQSPGDVVFLSFSDGDLGAAAAAWAAMAEPRPRLRLANLRHLQHPMSVDVYLERTIAHARCVVVRLLGGVDYWRYGIEEVFALCNRTGIALAVIPGEGRSDGRLADVSTVGAEHLARIEAFLRHGGSENLTRALRLAEHLAGLADDLCEPALCVPNFGIHAEHTCAGPLAVVVFYRSHLLSGDVEPIDALSHELHRRGFCARSVYVSSLKDEEVARQISRAFAAWRPVVVLNATGFSAQRGGVQSPLDAADVPVLQVLLASSTHEAWRDNSRGLGQADLAMQVVLPDLDGRITTAPISFKAETETMSALEFARTVHRAYAPGIRLAGSFAERWSRLSRKPAAERCIAIVLSDYPGAGGQVGHAVGLDTFASVEEIGRVLAAHGYDTGAGLDARTLVGADAMPLLPAADYVRQIAYFDPALREKIDAAWGDVAADLMHRDEQFWWPYVRRGNILLVMQPDRGHMLDRKASYHDPDIPPRHGYIAFYLWLRMCVGVDAIIHLGAHGTTEWLPGKAVAVSERCFPPAILDGMPVIYPFIVSNPGEAAAAKRRLGAVIIGHMTPPLKGCGSVGDAVLLERLLDEYAAADGLDQRRMALLRTTILDRARECGLLSESGISPDAPEYEALAGLEAYLCDVKDLQVRDGLHVFGRAPAEDLRAELLSSLARTSAGLSRSAIARRLDASPAAEMAGLIAALDGRFVPAGPAGSPTRGRADVLPTGRNIFAVDPRAVPARSSVVLAQRAAGELLRRHLQDHGAWPRRIVLDLWASTSMRTGGEDLALAFVLLGTLPVWDEESNRVAGFEIVPLATLDRPRVDVCLRMSGLFRDAFETQIRLFDAAVQAVSKLQEDHAFNPLSGSAGAVLRVFGTAPGAYGAGVADLTDRGAWAEKRELGAAFMAGSAYAYGGGEDGSANPEQFAAYVASADAFVHHHDDPGSDLLDTTEQAAHAGGFAAAAASFGHESALYQMDITRADDPRVRATKDEIARIVRGRAANPEWIEGMKRHGYRGAAEVARSVEALFVFAATMPDRFDHQFDLLFQATLGDPATNGFLQAHNPAARAAMAARFAEALQRGLWQTRRNAASAVLAQEIEP